jgi:hypothetical protein
MENGPFIDGLPIKNGGSFHGYVSHNQMVLQNCGGLHEFHVSPETDGKIVGD